MKYNKNKLTKRLFNIARKQFTDDELKALFEFSNDEEFTNAVNEIKKEKFKKFLKKRYYEKFKRKCCNFDKYDLENNEQVKLNMQYKFLAFIDNELAFKIACVTCTNELIEEMIPLYPKPTTAAEQEEFEKLIPVYISNTHTEI